MITKDSISYADFIDSLLANLPEREREVLQKRNALSEQPKHTLEKIGRDFSITRERVRQIEREGLKKINTFDYDSAGLPLDEIEAMVTDFLQQHGGIMSEEHLIDRLVEQKNETERQSLNFILSNILANKINRQPAQTDINTIWSLPTADLEKALKIAAVLKEHLNTKEQPLTIEQILEGLAEHQVYKDIDQHEAENEAVIEALLRIIKDLKQNILKQWGFNHWTTIKPKRMTDKAYLIMQQENRPLHFSEVADLINKAEFDRKKAHPATVHNELILDDKYVLVGRGIYALKDWGYQSGTVADIISSILKENGPMTKKDLAEEVLKQRLVQKTTITLVLMNKDKFKRTTDGKYSLV